MYIKLIPYMFMEYFLDLRWIHSRNGSNFAMLWIHLLRTSLETFGDVWIHRDI